MTGFIKKGHAIRKDYVEFVPVVAPLFDHYINCYLKEKKTTIPKMCEKHKIGKLRLINKMTGKENLDLKYIMWVVTKLQYPITLI